VIERVERNDDLTRAEPVREVRQAKENSPGKANKKFVAELEEKISEEKNRKKEKKEKDEIILHDEKGSPVEEDKKNDDNNVHQKNQPPPPSPDGQRGKKIDVLA